jgi:hypothetical protein
LEELVENSNFSKKTGRKLNFFEKLVENSNFSKKTGRKLNFFEKLIESQFLTYHLHPRGPLPEQLWSPHCPPNSGWTA